MKINFNIEKPSSIALLAPFFLIIFYSENFISNLTITFFILALVDFFLIKSLNKIFLFLSFNLLSFFFYAFIIYKDSLHVIHELRFRHFSVLFLFFTSVIYYLGIYRFRSFKFHNVFLIVFGLTILVKPLLISNKEGLINELKPSFEWDNKNYNKSNKPIVLIILDELPSSTEIFKFSQDSIDFKLGKELSKMGFFIKDPFMSVSTHTRYSIPSILNFNLHTSEKIKVLEKNSKLRTADEDMIYLIERNLLADSLNTKSISSFSYGLLPFKNSSSLVSNFKYPWGTNNDDIAFLKNYAFINLALKSSSFGFFYKLYNRKSVYGSEKDNFRKQVINELSSGEFLNNTFYYFHLYMPHYPFSYFDEYPLEGKAENLRGEDFNNYMASNRYLLEYIEYSRFSTEKILKILSLDKFEDCRIIITGDHGFRGTAQNAEEINPHLTSIYTKGFREKDIETLKSVQDLSYLIFNSF